ncbi:hypothetical protein RRG08_006272 [Elysia crispata]|uniref:Uncharacterized protein n=1 Tax=Elysia crispata TaxID=231223 RepID=A0AAE1D2C6_9GAST|nr:hypothetical protein RRG08_006272 [Elysia crispata]
MGEPPGGLGEGLDDVPAASRHDQLSQLLHVASSARTVLRQLPHHEGHLFNESGLPATLYSPAVKSGQMLSS